MKRRVIRLIASLWPMLTVVLALFWIFNISFSIKSFVLNYCLMGWFSKLPGFGHLWFVTMIFLCYFMFAALSHLRRDVSGWWLLPSFMVSTVCAICIQHIGLPGYLFLILFYCSTLFLHWEKILKWANETSMVFLVGMTILCSVLTLALFYIGALYSGGLCMYYATSLCGVMLLLCLYRLIQGCHPCNFLIYLSAISYEIYLVHHPFCFGQFSVFQFTGGKWWVGVPIIIAISLVLSIVLNRLSRFILHRLNE